jgi:hypothetical protein
MLHRKYSSGHCDQDQHDGQDGFPGPTCGGQSCEYGRNSYCRHRLHLLDCSRLGDMGTFP